MTIDRLTGLIQRERQDQVIGTEEVTRMVNALEARLCTEIFLTHEGTPPGVYAFMGLPVPGWEPGDWPPPPPPHEPGYSEDWCFSALGELKLLAPPPFDDIYLQYVRWQTAQANNDTYDEGNAAKRYYAAYNDFARFWNRTHMPRSRPVVQ